MKAFILAAGYGRRLKPITDIVPKPLVSVWGKPVISHIIENLIDFGIKEFVLNLHHLGYIIEEYLSLKYKKINFFYSKEDILLDTGGGLKKASIFLKDGDFLMHNGDILTKFDFYEMISYHMSLKNDITLAILDRDSSRKLCFDKDMCLCGWLNKEKKIGRGVIENVNMFSFAGVHIISPVVFDYMPKDEVFGVFDFYMSLIGKLKIKGFLIKPIYWYDIGSIEKLNNIRKNPLF